MAKLRIMLYGGNPASVMNSLAIGLKKKNCEVRGYCFLSNKYINYSDVIVLPDYPAQGLMNKLQWKSRFYLTLTRGVFWADVIHIFWDCNLYLRCLSWLLRKQRVVTFVGSEVRIPEVSLQYNPYYRLAHEHSSYEYKDIESGEKSRDRQRRFCRCGFKVIVWDTFRYIDEKICKRLFIVPHASVNTTPEHEERHDVISVVHAPTAPVAKGSRFVIEAMSRIQQKFPAVRFQVLTNVSNEQYQQAIADCDILIDQFIWGAYGIATQQALEMGKIVVCYLNESIAGKIFPADIPLVNATVDDLEAKLEEVLQRQDMRERIAREAKRFYKETHSPEAVAEKVIAVYKA